MARSTTRYVCQACGGSFPKWGGKCESCGEWNSLVEEASSASAPKGLGKGAGRRIEFVGLTGSSPPPPRRTTGLGELDRVCGGGFVPGSALLVGGDPGIGKSTLLLQAACALSQTVPVAYISGEESEEQVRLRALRLGLSKSSLYLASATNVRDIVASLDLPDGPRVAIIDSIQTMFVDNLDSAPGTVAQVRTSAQELIRVAKKRDVTLILVGHVTKEGAIAGPRVLEHMVDTVLYFEGERGHQFRILRAVKNRFGPTDEIGVFEMTEEGLMEVANPSELFLAERRGESTGTAVFAGMEGTRPLLVEVQALVAPSPLGTPRRAVVGWDNARLSMVLAVLEARCGVSVGPNDVYLNIAGGLRINEPAADLAVAAALLSSLANEPVPIDTVVFGEVGLSGEIRPVSQTDLRLKEASKLGFSKAFMPHRRPGREKNQKTPSSPLKAMEVRHLTDLLPLFNLKRRTRS